MEYKEALKHCETLEDYYIDESGELSKFITNQQQTIEKLKCCGNCGATYSENKHPCRGCRDHSNWQPKENI